MPAPKIAVEYAGRRVVIIDPAFLGDAVFDGPLARVLKARSAQSVGLVVRPPADTLGRRMPHVDHVHCFDKHGRHRGFGGLLRMAQDLRAFRYDIAVVVHGSLRSRFLARLSGIPHRVAVPGHPRFSRAQRAQTGLGFVEQRIAAVEPFPGSNALSLRGTLLADPASVARSQTTRSRRIGWVLGAHWATKRWAGEPAARLLARLQDFDCQLVFFGRTEEADLYQALLAHGFGHGSTECRFGESVESMVDGIASCDVLLAGDTGPLHIARALGVPVVALFGPTPKEVHRFEEGDRVLSTALDCQPCSAHGDPVCPKRHHRCMQTLDWERVFGALSEVLGLAN
jgi:heptosyltransferase II